MSINEPGPFMDEAIRWFSRVRSGELGEADRKFLDAWLSQADHRQAYRKVELLWQDIEPLRSEPRLLAMQEAGSGRRRPVWAWAAAALFCFAVSLAGWNLLYSPAQVQTASTKVFKSDVGQKRTLALSDGSIIVLDAASSIRVSMQGSTRHIWLDHGRALFRVRHSRSHPFQVEVGDEKVTALGTEFSIDHTSASLDIVLLSGRLRVESSRGPAERSVEIKAGTGVHIDPVGRWSLSEFDTATKMAWLDGKLVFNDATLAEVVSQLQRYNRRKITIADDATGSKRLNAVLRIDDEETFLGIVQALNLAAIVRNADGDIILSNNDRP